MIPQHEADSIAKFTVEKLQMSSIYRIHSCPDASGKSDSRHFLKWTKVLATLLAVSSSMLIGSTLLPEQAIALEVGSLSEIEGDVSCGMRRTGGTLVYAETANNLIHLCADPSGQQVRHLLVFNRHTDGETFVTSSNPQQMRYFEFVDTRSNLTYVLQIPSGAIPEPVFAVELSNGLRFEEEITRYLARAADQSGQPDHAVVLRRGDRGQAVINLQRDLANLGFNPGAIDGVFGVQTETALRTFQRRFGIPVTGVYDRASSQVMFNQFD